MNNKLDQIEKLYHEVLQEIESQQGECEALFHIYYDLIIALSEASALHFNTLFARVSFISSRYPITKTWRYVLQIPRREMQARTMPQAELLPILKACIQLLLALGDVEFGSANTIEEPPLPEYVPQKRTGSFVKKFSRVSVVEWSVNEKQMVILDEEEPDHSRILLYCVADVNDLFADTLEIAVKEIGLPLTLGLTDVSCTDEGHYVPGYIVILPDMLLDVTSVTQVISDGPEPNPVNAIDVFKPKVISDPLMIGHMANFFLDEMIRDTKKPFKEIFTDAFRVFPIEFVGMPDEKVRHIYEKMAFHYRNIQRVIEDRFPVLGIDPKACVIEPSYYSPKFGLKGRLDLYYENEDDQVASIIELKSGKPFKPNKQGLSSANYHQTLLYDLLLRSGHGASFKRSNYILYSGEAVDSLRFAVSVEAIQKETIHHRNQLVVLQFRLMRLDQKDAVDIFGRINTENYPALSGYVKRDVENWHKTYASLSSGEQQYFNSFTAFITREHALARIGSDHGDGSGGLAGLWLDSFAKKEERYHILQQLSLSGIHQEGHQTKVTFSRTEQTNPLANFRAGDIIVMYPYFDNGHYEPTDYQLHRASIIDITPETIVIRLRNMQVHTAKIEKYSLWNLERDMLDSGFRSLYQSLWLLMNASKPVRHTILGLVPPRLPMTDNPLPVPDGLTNQQRKIYQDAIQAGSMYLLWGPPGTGKTSVMLKSWAWYYATQTDQRIVLLAYTNKAVDEICEALESVNERIAGEYIRIGSGTATGERYRDKLFDGVIKPMTTRAEIKARLENTSVFVATISSFHSKIGLFDLLTFDVAIMDEASQLLEPTVVGLLTRFKKTILIGDHMQLPAVSVQSDAMSLVDPERTWSQRIGVTDMRMSYFERMFRLYTSKQWNDYIGMLNEQGRMHSDIMNIVNDQVYDGFLKTINPIVQGQPLETTVGGEDNPLFSHRLIFIPSKCKLAEVYLKTNQDEADIIVKLLEKWQARLEASNLTWSIGVITPFRAQIAAITHLAHLKGIDMTDITIDTVERYQGGARDIILMSCAANMYKTIQKISSVNAEGVDRKLNVAISRARHQFVLIGNKDVLLQAEGYRRLIEKSYSCTSGEMFESHYHPAQ